VTFRLTLPHTSDIAHPVRVIVIDIAKALAVSKPKLSQGGATGSGPVGAVILAIDMEVVQVFITPLEEDLYDGVELSQRGGVVHENPTPDQRTDVSKDNAQLIDVAGIA
jgi:hypothetical protein